MGMSQLSEHELIVFGQFQGMNTQTDRHALPEDRPAWLENVQPIGPNNIKTVPAASSSALATLTGETITRQFFAPINGINYLICFCTSGSAYAVDLSDGSQTKFANSGTFSNAPDMTTWNRQRILIADSKAGYSTWDGTAFIEQGGVSPNIIVTNGGMYSGTPTVTISGGSGTGATAVANMTDGVVTSITLTSAGSGYMPGDILTVAFSGGSPAAGVLQDLVLTNGGNGYTSLPTVVFTYSAAGTGGAAQAGVTVNAGPVVSLTLTNPGMGITGPVTVSFTGGGGANAAATVGVSTLASATAVVWPFISPAPTTIAVFQGRVFLAEGGTLTYTGTEGYDDVNPGNGAGTFTISDADLITTVTALRYLNNYLYVIGDNSVKQIGNLSISGAGITNFTLVTLSSDQGTTFQGTVVSFDRTMFFANTVGVYTVFGSSVQKISNDMDGIFQNIDFTQQPVAAVNDINNIHTYLLLVKYKDPLSSTRSIMLSESGLKWFVISQGNALKYIATCVIDGVTETFATSGSDITQLLKDPTTPVSITIRTALSAHEKPFMGKNSLRAAVAQLSGTQNNAFTLSIDSENSSQSINYTPGVPIINFVNNLGNIIQFQNNLGQNIYFFTSNAFTYFVTRTQNVQGVYLGCTLTGQATNFSLNTIILEYKETALFGLRA